MKYIFFAAMAIGIITLLFIIRHIVLSIRERLKEHKELKSEKIKREADLRRLKSLWSNVTKSRDNLREHLKFFSYKEIIPDNVQYKHKLTSSIKFRYEQRLALYEFNNLPTLRSVQPIFPETDNEPDFLKTSNFYLRNIKTKQYRSATKADIDNAYQKIIEKYKEYENAWEKFNNTLQETDFKHDTFLSLL